MIINETTKSLEERVYMLLEEAILTGEYTRGDSLTEIALSKKLGVSRTPIRSALHRLAEDGLIEITPNRGAIVMGVNTDDLVDIYILDVKLPCRELFLFLLLVFRFFHHLLLQLLLNSFLHLLLLLFQIQILLLLLQQLLLLLYLLLIFQDL